MDKKIIKILKINGWEVECESPLQIRHEDGSFATGLGAQYTIDVVVGDFNDLESPIKILTSIKGHLEDIFVGSLISPIMYDGTHLNNKVSVDIMDFNNKMVYKVLVEDTHNVLLKNNKIKD